jgi:hypothetical protein
MFDDVSRRSCDRPDAEIESAVTRGTSTKTWMYFKPSRSFELGQPKLAETSLKLPLHVTERAFMRFIS